MSVHYVGGDIKVIGVPSSITETRSSAFSPGVLVYILVIFKVTARQKFLANKHCLPSDSFVEH